MWQYVLLMLLRVGPALSSGKSKLPGSRIGGLLPIGTLVLRNLGRSRIRTLITVLSLFLSALLHGHARSRACGVGRQADSPGAATPYRGVNNPRLKPGAYSEG
jgi:hypothetical protein